MIWDPSFHTENNRGTQTQLLQKVQSFTDAPEGHTMHYEPGVKTFEFEDQGKLYFICLPGNMQVSSVASEGQY